MRDDGAEQGFLRAVFADGAALLLGVAAALVAAGVFLGLVGASGQFLPHDIGYLGMTPDQLCAVADCRVVQFMIHDRVAFGGALFGIGTLYGYLVLFPLKRGEPWAWWALAVSGGLGFATFLGYLSHDYLDAWHAIGSLLLFPVFVIGLIRARRIVSPGPPTVLITSGGLPPRTTRHGLGRWVLLAGAGGTAVGGLTILWVGITQIFVAEDVSFIGVPAARLDAVNPRLLPLIAHDRIGFGGAVTTLGLTALMILWCSDLTRALWEAIAVSGGVSLTAAIGIHAVVGYTDPRHLAPAVVAGLSMVVGLAATAPRARRLVTVEGRSST